MKIYLNPNEYFESKVNNLPCMQETRAYIQGVLVDLRRRDFSNQSVTLIFAKASATYDFELFQNLADWLLFARSVFPASLAEPDYCDTLGQISYLRCFKLLNKKWKLYEELSDNFPTLVRNLRANF